MSDTKEHDVIERNIYDRIMWSHERDRDRLVALLLVAMILLAVWAVTETVLRHIEHNDWIHFIEQYDFESYDLSQDGEGVNIIGSGKGVMNGATATCESNEAQNTEQGQR